MPATEVDPRRVGLAGTLFLLGTLCYGYRMMLPGVLLLVLAGGWLVWQARLLQTRAWQQWLAGVALVLAVGTGRDLAIGLDDHLGLLEGGCKGVWMALVWVALSRLAVRETWRGIAAWVAGLGLALTLFKVGAAQLAEAVRDPLHFYGHGFETNLWRNNLSVYVGVIFLAALVWWRDEGQGGRRWLAVLAVALAGWLLLVNGARSEVMGAACAAAVLLYRHDRCGFLAMLVLGSAGGLLLFLTHPDFFIHGTVLNQRDLIYARVLPAIADNPWVGHGAGYFLAHLQPLLMMVTPPPPHPHSIYLDLMLSYGLLGVLLVLLASWRLGRLLMRASAGLLLPDVLVIFLLVCGAVDYSFRVPLNVAALLWVMPLLHVLICRRMVGNR